MPTELPADDKSRLRAAEGWLELGLPDEAANELASLSAEAADHPLPLMIKWRVHAAMNDWEPCVGIGQRLVELDPDDSFGWIHRSYALHELKRTREASDLLLPALEKFPEEELIPYNLACYACQLGQQDEAKRLLKSCISRTDRNEIKERALEDPDLKPLKDYIESL